jgi:FixJ family two-component response regulator
MPLARIMVVDDDEAVARQLGLGLRALGFEVDVTGSMAQALDVLSTAPEICVVVTDIRMPGGSGLDLAKAVSTQRAGPTATEVIIITGHATIEDAATAMRCGAVDFLPKPFRLKEAGDAVKKAVDRAVKRRSEAVAACEDQLSLARLQDDRKQLEAKLAEAERRFNALSVTPPNPVRDLDRARLAVSHALRTPLNLITGGATLMAGAPNADSQAEYLELLRAGVDDAVAAVELVEELNRLQGDEQVAMNAFDVAAYVHAIAEAFMHESAIAVTCAPGLESSPMLVMASPLRIRRAITLCLGAAAEWANPTSQLRCETGVEDEEGRRYGCFTVIVSPADQVAVPPTGITFEESTSFLTRTQESLRFFIARRLVAHCGGMVTSWSGSPGSAAIRMALPLLGRH